MMKCLSSRNSHSDGRNCRSRGGGEGGSCGEDKMKKQDMGVGEGLWPSGQGRLLGYSTKALKKLLVSSCS